jgi:metal-responsive CopG/Arc/MetJ family transcriptional regulator
MDDKGMAQQAPSGSILGGMKVKTSVTLSQEVLRAVDRVMQGGESRSEVIERALKAYVANALKRERDARELDILNREARRLNAEAIDVLEYQILP